MADDHGWRGDGRFRLARLHGRLILRFGNVSTKRTRLKADMGAFFRKHYKGLRPRYGGFAVSIYVECVNPNRRLDADNVAKACLDAMTGIAWRDDSQVMRLSVEKIEADQDAVTVVIEPARRGRSDAVLAELITEIEALR